MRRSPPAREDELARLLSKEVAPVDLVPAVVMVRITANTVGHVAFRRGIAGGASPGRKRCALGFRLTRIASVAGKRDSTQR